MKVGKHVEEALRSAYYGAQYGVKRADDELARLNGVVSDYNARIYDANERREEAVAAKVEIRTTMIKLGLDPELGHNEF